MKDADPRVLGPHHLAGPSCRDRSPKGTQKLSVPAKEKGSQQEAAARAMLRGRFWIRGQRELSVEGLTRGFPKMEFSRTACLAMKHSHVERGDCGREGLD